MLVFVREARREIFKYSVFPVRNNNLSIRIDL